MPRPTPFLLALLGAWTLAGCTGGSGPHSDSGLARSFELDNYRRSDNTNGTQTRPDVNRAYTQPALPSIINRGN